MVLTSLTLTLTGCHIFHEDGSRSSDIRVMTFNIRNGLAKDGKNHWHHRKQFVCDIIHQYSPDILGVQEAFRFQMDEFNQRLPEYEEVGTGRDGGTKGEYSAILYRRQRFDLHDSGTFWLSDTPTEPSAHWGNHYLRICTWARLTDKQSAQSFYVFNTHLDHQSQKAREKGVQLIMEYISNRTHNDPFVLTGDFNAGEDNPVIKYLKGSVKLMDSTPIPVVDSFRVLHPDTKIVGTGNRFQGRSNGAKIDYIFTTKETQAIETAIIRTNREGRYPSDHFPVTAQLRFKFDFPAIEEAVSECLKK